MANWMTGRNYEEKEDLLEKQRSLKERAARALRFLRSDLEDLDSVTLALGDEDTVYYPSDLGQLLDALHEKLEGR